MKTFNTTDTVIILCHFTDELRLTETKEMGRKPQQRDAKGAKRRQTEERRGVKSKRGWEDIIHFFLCKYEDCYLPKTKMQLSAFSYYSE